MENNGDNAVPIPCVIRDGTLVEQQLYLLDTGLMADCTFVVGNENMEKTFHCHKLMLSKSSQVFYAMFNGSLVERGDIVVDDIVPSAFRKLLEYIYTDTVDLEDVETALGVCYAAHKYLIKLLQTKCETFIKEHLAARNVCQALELSRLVSNHELEELCIEFIKRSTADILATETFKQADRETLVTIVKLETLNVRSELSLFLACLSWAEAHLQEGQTLRDSLGPEVLRYIRFLSMSPDEYTVHVCPTKILTPFEERNILRCLYANTTLMPVGFSSERNTRVPYAPETRIERLIINVHSNGIHHQDTSRYMCAFSFSVNTTFTIQGFVMYGWRSEPGSYSENLTFVLRQGNEDLATVNCLVPLYGYEFNVYFSTAVRVTAGSYELYTRDAMNNYSAPVEVESTFSSAPARDAVYIHICHLILTPR